MKKHNAVSRATREQVLERDQYTCQKCGIREKLELHHIIPLAKEGSDEIDNLITLCISCHREWEHLIYPHVRSATFEQWLELPTCVVIYSLIKDVDKSIGDLTVRELRLELTNLLPKVRSIMNAYKEGISLRDYGQKGVGGELDSEDKEEAS